MRARRVIRIVVVWYAVFCAILAIFLAELAFHPQRTRIKERQSAEATATRFGATLRDVSVVAGDGSHLQGWFARPAKGMHQQSYELHKLLETARIRPPPYVAVGWSLGGMIDRLDADAYPGEVRGMVLVDATHEDIAFVDKRFRELFRGKPIPAPQTMKSSPPIALTVEEQKHFDDRRAQKLKESQEPAPDPWNRLKADDLRLWRFADMNVKPISSTKG